MKQRLRPRELAARSDEKRCAKPAAFRRGVCAVLVVALAGCYYDVQKANQMQMPWGQRVEVTCMGGKSMSIDFVPAPRAARVLPQVDAASDAKFTDGRYILYVNDQRAALEETGILLRGPCTPR